jgi:hypothetical protein
VNGADIALECRAAPVARIRAKRYLLPTPQTRGGTRDMAEREQLLAQFAEWSARHITGDEKGQA